MSATSYKIFKSGNNNVLTINGAIVKTSGASFKAFLDKNKDAKLDYVLLQSNGGNIAQSLVMSELIKKLNIPTLVETYCRSACFNLLMAGSESRIYIDAYVTIHRPYYDKPEVIVEDKINSKVFKSMTKYYSSLGNKVSDPEAITRLIYSVPSITELQITKVDNKKLPFNFYENSILN